MTLVIAAVGHGLAVQVADRLVSLQRGQRLEALDQSANKMLVYVARDAHVSIAYAGQAFIKGKPTDEVIAEVLAGQTFDRGPNEFCGVGLGGGQPKYDIGLALKRVVEALSSGILPNQSIQLLVAGHQFNRHKLVRPLLCRVEIKSDGALSGKFLPRDFPRGRGIIDSIGVGLTKEERNSIADSIFGDPSVSTPDQVAIKLTGAIRLKAAPGIGPHTSAALLPMPGHAPIELAFFPVEPHVAILRSTRGDIEFVAEIMPWVIGQGLVKPPTAEVGRGEFSIAGTHVVTRGSPAPAGAMNGNWLRR